MTLAKQPAYLERGRWATTLTSLRHILSHTQGQLFFWKWRTYGQTQLLLEL